MSGWFKKKWNVKEDVVLLHQYDRGKNAPSITPFPLKLETYLRMASIPYENDFKNPIGPKGKTPWITLNGEDIADSQLCLELLAQKYNKDFSSHLSIEEKAVARSMQIMVEEHLYWVLVLWQWIYTEGKTITQIYDKMPPFFWLLAPILRRQLRNQTNAQGLGRHTEAEATEMGVKDLRALSNFLGEKKFLFGDNPIEEDCAIFGMLSQCVWNMPGSPFEQLMNGELANLKGYCERMKARFWPDWDSCLSPPRS